jgi:hypothetical protein
VIQAELALELFVVQLDLPAQPREACKALRWVSAGRFEIQYSLG